MRRFALILLLSTSACLTRGAPMVQVLGKLAGAQVGWSRITPLLALDADGALLLPPANVVDREDPAPYMERVERLARRQHAPLPALESGTPCREVRNGTDADARTLYVLIHGIGGVGNEWLPVVPTLAKTGPAALYMYRWFGYDERASIVKGLVDGVERLAECWPDSPIVIIGHSAGGVVAAFAASRFDLHGRTAPFTILTVASPLAGVGAQTFTGEEDEHTQFFNDLGAVHRGYAAAAPGVTVVHFRTQYPGDVIMKPSRAGYSPNAISAVVKGSRVVDLPDTLTHENSLMYVAMQLSAGKLQLTDAVSAAR